MRPRMPQTEVAVQLLRIRDGIYATLNADEPRVGHGTCQYVLRIVYVDARLPLELSVPIIEDGGENKEDGSGLRGLDPRRVLHNGYAFEGPQLPKL